MSGFDMSGYVDVKTRIRLFYDKHPDGRLTTESVSISEDPDGQVRVWVHAKAYRTPDDPHPGDGWSWLGVPGGTSYTRGSELENAETSAWGRAISALGIGIDKGIASGEEIQSKQPHDAPRAAHNGPRGAIRSFTGMAVTWNQANRDGQIRMDPEDIPHYGFILECEDDKKRHVDIEGDLAIETAMANPIGQVVKVTGPYKVEDLPKKGGGFYKAGVIYAQSVTAPDGTPLAAPASDAADVSSAGTTAEPSSLPA